MKKAIEPGKKTKLSGSGCSKTTGKDSKSMLKLYILNLVLNTPPASAMPEGEVWRTSTKHTMTVIEISSRHSEISSRRMKSLCEDTKPEKGLRKKASHN
jgi:hypothetical protein